MNHRALAIARPIEIRGRPQSQPAARRNGESVRRAEEQLNLEPASPIEPPTGR